MQTAECHDGECHCAKCCGAPKASFQIKILFVNDFQIPDHLRSDDDTTAYTLVSVLYAFSSSLTHRQNKLECFCLKSFFRLVWKDWASAWWANIHWARSQRHRFMCKHKLLMSSLTHPNLFEGLQQEDESCCWVCHGRFHGILPKEYSRTFHELFMGTI